MCPSTSIFDLPYEIMVEILSHLSLEQLMMCNQVCQQWQQISQDPALWKELIYTPADTESYTTIISTLRQMPGLQNIDLSKGPHLTNAIVETICEYCPNIRKLLLHTNFCYSKDLLCRLILELYNLESFQAKFKLNECKYFVGLLCQTKNLRDLSMILTDGTSYQAGLLKPIADHCKLLKGFTLSLGFHAYVRDILNVVHDLKDSLTKLRLASMEIYEHSRDIFINFTKLQALEIGHAGYNTYDLSLLGRLPSLKSFSLGDFSYCNNLHFLFTQNSMTQLVRLEFDSWSPLRSEEWFIIFNCVPNLQEFCFYRLSTRSPDNVLDILFTCCPHLVSLEIPHNSLTDYDLANIYKCSKLKTLDLSKSERLTYRCLHYVLKCPQITNINVSDNRWMTDKSLHLLFQCSQLHVLKANDCKNIRGTVFNQIPKHLKYLRELHILQESTWRRLPDECLYDLRSQMPNLSIYN